MTTGSLAKSLFSVKRTYIATIEEVWELWTTKFGIEAWWGPEGFEVSVNLIDLRPDGKLLYVMTGVGIEQVKFMKRAGMPLATECTITYTAVEPPKRLVYKTITDFVPGIAPYEVATVVTLKETGNSVEVLVICDAMHDDVWTERARAGHESQMRKLDQILTTAVPGVST